MPWSPVSVAAHRPARSREPTRIPTDTGTVPLGHSVCAAAQVVDEAKKRAVGQHVDYDTFKNMVSVAHLKPIGAPNTAGSGRRGGLLPRWLVVAGEPP